MACINFLAFSIKHFSVQHWRTFFFGLGQNHKVRDFFEDGPSQSFGIFWCCLGYRVRSWCVALVLLHTQSLELSVWMTVCFTLLQVAFGALTWISRAKLRPSRLVTLRLFDGSGCLGLRLFITGLVFDWIGRWVIWVVESRRLSSLPLVNITVIFSLSKLWQLLAGVITEWVFGIHNFSHYVVSLWPICPESGILHWC